MAKKTTTPEVSKADAIRNYAKNHPEAGPQAIAAALKKDGIEVTAGRCSGVLRTGSPKVDVDQIKAASTFCKGFNGKIEEALAAIDQVGSFVD